MGINAKPEKSLCTSYRKLISSLLIWGGMSLLLYSDLNVRVSSVVFWLDCAGMSLMLCSGFIVCVCVSTVVFWF